MPTAWTKPPVGYERQRNAGERQNIDRTEYVQTGLEHQQTGGRACGDGVKAGASGTAGADSEHGQRNDAQDGQHGNDETPFLTQHTEHDIGIRGREISRASPLAGTDADHAAGGGCGQRMRLLEALVVHVLPDMSPGGKSLRQRAA